MVCSKRTAMILLRCTVRLTLLLQRLSCTDLAQIEIETRRTRSPGWATNTCSLPPWCAILRRRCRNTAGACAPARSAGIPRGTNRPLGALVRRRLPRAAGSAEQAEEVAVGRVCRATEERQAKRLLDAPQRAVVIPGDIHPSDSLGVIRDHDRDHLAAAGD